jgi:hypothetical protein
MPDFIATWRAMLGPPPACRAQPAIVIHVDDPHGRAGLERIDGC